MFERAGFVPLPAFLTERDLREAREGVEVVLARPLPAGCARPHNTLVPLRWNDGLVVRVLRSERLVKAIAGAVGAKDLRWISGYVSVKEPRSPALWWHQDWWCWRHAVTFERQTPQVAVLCYLDGTAVGNGALRVVPGSHRRSLPLHAVLPETHACGHLDPQHPAMTDHPDQITFEANPGDAIVIDYRLLHGTHPNTESNRRDCLILNFAPWWHRLPADIRAHPIRHPAQPSQDEKPEPALLRLLPSFAGRPRDLPLSRDAPTSFVIG